MTSFREWHEEADMPAQREDGSWYDMETGIGFNDACDDPKVVRARIADQLFDKQLRLAKERDERGRDFDAMLEYFGLTAKQFEDLDQASLFEYRKVAKSKRHISDYSDHKRQMWHDWREHLGSLYKKEHGVPLRNDAYRIRPRVSKSKVEKPAWQEQSVKKAAEARKTAHLHGGKALTGSVKQKSWGEGIRKAFLERVSDKAVVEVALSKPEFGKAKFWIDNRNLRVDDLANIILGSAS